MNDTAAHPPTDAADADAGKTIRKKRRRWRWRIVLLVVVCYAVYAYWPPDNRIVVSRETTYLTGPLKADGTVDYVEAIRHRLSEGVTPENNAAPLLLRALGPGLLPDEGRAAILAELGLGDLPADGDYFIRVKDYAKTLLPEQRDALLEEDDYDFSPRYITKRWLPAEFPQLAAWLAHNDGPLDVLVAATSRPRLYFPLTLDEDDSVWDVQLPELSVYRATVLALRARCMLRLTQGDPAAAWQDILACYRLAGLVAQDPFLICDIVSYGFDGIACEATEALLTSGSMPPEELRAILADLKALPPAPHPADGFEWERLFSLDYITRFASGRHSASMATGASGSDLWARRAIDWNLVLKMHNARFDEIIAALRLDRLDNSQVELARVDEAVRSWRGWRSQELLRKTMTTLGQTTDGPPDCDDAVAWAAWKARLGGRPFRGTASRGTAKAMQQLLLPEVGRLRMAYDRTTMRRKMIEVAIGLELYERDHEKYPAAFEDMGADYVDQIPIDCFSGKPVRYVRTDDTCRIYSVGRNEIDDGGFNYYDDFWIPNSDSDYKLLPGAVMPEGMTEDADDIVIELGRAEE